MLNTALVLIAITNCKLKGGGCVSRGERGNVDGSNTDEWYCTVCVPLNITLLDALLGCVNKSTMISKTKHPAGSLCVNYINNYSLVHPAP